MITAAGVESGGVKSRGGAPSAGDTDVAPTAFIGARTLGDLLARYEIRPTKSLGQNFVIDPNTIRKVVDAAALGPSEHVLEIGAGVGSLTVALASAASAVVAVEVDGRVIAALREVLAGRANVTIVHGDALALDLGSFGATSVVANLPYNIAATVVLRVLETAPSIEKLTVMTQREVGERLAASPGSKTYGRTSVLVKLYGEARVAARISRNAFHPVPKVDSVLVSIVRNPPGRVGDTAAAARVVDAAFAQRRKMLRNNLSALWGSQNAADAALRRAGIAPEARAEQLAVEDFKRLAELVE